MAQTLTAYSALDGHYPAERLQSAGPDAFGTEYMDYKMAIKTVDSLEEALAHIRKYGSGHSEAIVTENASAARRSRRAWTRPACMSMLPPASRTVRSSAWVPKSASAPRNWAPAARWASRN